MKKQLALALTAALLAFPVTPSLVMADTTGTGTTAVTTTTTQPSVTSTDPTSSSSSTTTTPSSSADTSTGTGTSTSTGTSTTTNSTTIPSTGTDTVVDQNGQTVDPGTLPDSPFYWFQTLIEKVQVALTFDPAKKANLVERQACEKLAEAQALIKKGNEAEAEKTLTEYSNKIEQAQTFLDQLKDPNSDTSQKVQAVLTKVNTNNMVVLGGLLEKLPPQAAQKLALNIVRSVEKAIAKAEKIDNKEVQTASTGTATDSVNATQTSTSTTATTTTGTSADTTTSQGGTADLAQLREQAKQALEQFQIELGLKKADHTPNGNAYGYYQNKKDKVEKEDQNKDQDENENSNQAVQQQNSTQTQTQTQQGAVQQYQAHQPQVNHSAKTTAPKDHEDQGKGDKERGHRD